MTKIIHNHDKIEIVRNDYELCNRADIYVKHVQTPLGFNNFNAWSRDEYEEWSSKHINVVVARVLQKKLWFIRRYALQDQNFF